MSVSYAEDRFRSNCQRLSVDARKTLSDRLSNFIFELQKSRYYSSPYDRIKLIYEVLSTSLQYDYNEKNNARYTFASCVAFDKAVCMGIAELLTLIGQVCGLNISTIVGAAGEFNEELHAWNLISIPDPITNKPTHYHLDLTWDLQRSYTFSYFMKSDSYMNSKHHYWLTDRYPICPGNISNRCFSHIPKSEIKRLSMLFKGH